MPGYKGHLVGGAIAYGCTLFFVSSHAVTYATAASWFISCCAGALFPDIDIKSKGQKYFYWVLLCLLVWSIIQCRTYNTPLRLNILASLAIISCLPMLVRHRGITHEPLFIVGCAAIGWFFINSFYPCLAQSFLFHTLFFTAGALSHIILDKKLIKKRKRNF